MKKLATLLLAAGLVFCGVTGASAIDFKAKGQWIMNFEYGDGARGYSDTSNGRPVYGYNGGDSFNASQRVRLQLDAVASESLSGTVYFEIGNQNWGDADHGAALGADGVAIEVKQAYLDWVIPNTDVKVRMGIQGLGLPSYTTGGSQVFTQDVAGIVVSNKFNDNVAMTFFWARPYNDNFAGDDFREGYVANYLDNTDAFGLLLPMTFDGFAITPWVTYMAVGQNAYRSAFANLTADPVTGALEPDGTLGSTGGGLTSTLYGLLPAGTLGLAGAAGQAIPTEDLYAYGNVWHVGLTGEITAADPFRIAWDLNYGSADFGYVDFGVDDFELKRQGFYGSLLVEYKMDWGTPGLYGWYSTGDDDDPTNGSERMPVINNGNSDNQFSQFAGNGNPYIAREAVLGTSLIGTWGLGVRVKDFSFVEDLKHTFRVNYFGGTNSSDIDSVAFAALDARTFEAGFSNGNGMYMTTTDSAWEFGLSSDYQIYDNLKLYVDMAYLVLDFDEDTWGNNYTATDAFNINASFVYSF